MCTSRAPARTAVPEPRRRDGKEISPRDSSPRPEEQRVWGSLLHLLLVSLASYPLAYCQASAVKAQPIAPQERRRPRPGGARCESGGWWLHPREKRGPVRLRSEERRVGKGGRSRWSPY